MAKIKLIRLWNKEEHKAILNAHQNNVLAAAAYNRSLDELGLSSDISVSRQLVKYWRSIYITNGGSKAKANAGLQQARKLVSPSPSDDIGNTKVPMMSKRILVIGDLHEPYTHPDAYAFLESVRDSYKPDTVVQIGDELDGHALSFHDSNPNLDSAGVELEKAKLGVAKLHDLFKNVLVCDSNHGSLIYRRANAHGLPIQYIKKYRDILFPEHGAPGWSWGDAWDLTTPLGVVRFQHQVAGDLLLSAAHERKSMVIGHFHGKFNINYAASSSSLYFGAHCGCLIDNKSMAFAYGKLSKNKPILGVLTITDGCPSLVPMLLDGNGRWVGRNVAKEIRKKVVAKRGSGEPLEPMYGVLVGGHHE